MAHDYRKYLSAAGVKRLRGPLRTEKTPGSIELVWDPKVRDYVRYVHPERPRRNNVVALPRRKSKA